MGDNRGRFPPDFPFLLTKRDRPPPLLRGRSRFRQEFVPPDRVVVEVVGVLGPGCGLRQLRLHPLRSHDPGEEPQRRRLKDPLDRAIEEKTRLEAVQRTSLLDSPPEEAFDRLTRLATTVFRVPVALVALRDRERMWFKSQCGLPEPLESLRQTPLKSSFCRHVVEARQPLVVADAGRDPAFGDNPAVSSFGLISYAGVPLLTSEGCAIGTFCVLDRRPHDWTEEEIGILRVLAAATMSEIALKGAVGELRALTTDLQGLVEARTADLRASEQRHRVLLDVNNAIVTCLDRESLFSATATALARVVPFDRAALVLHDPDKDVFKVLGVADPVPAPAPATRPP